MPREDTSPEIFEEIDDNLRRAYEELLNEELPDRFKALLQQLREGSDPKESHLGSGEEAAE